MSCKFNLQVYFIVCYFLVTFISMVVLFLQGLAHYLLSPRICARGVKYFSHYCLLLPGRLKVLNWALTKLALNDGLGNLHSLEVSAYLTWRAMSLSYKSFRSSTWRAVLGNPSMTNPAESASGSKIVSSRASITYMWIMSWHTYQMIMIL